MYNSDSEQVRSGSPDGREPGASNRARATRGSPRASRSPQASRRGDRGDLSALFATDAYKDLKHGDVTLVYPCDGRPSPENMGNVPMFLVLFASWPRTIDLSPFRAGGVL